ncbi:hypothetical protein GCK72_000459 [Caenorhabditis remanei]|uniref:SET domain-containing protein n=1 Tax=Caenorhabditis remanei TaxID=31234 RepID=A0A6A5HQR8_CAERE|nr:hypothetical protein GCK72_000459 [Caenorhabditis remanei]KAF1768647.1 hypothetical protein GCK72_000459 [Caenorhabditis remanei]
MLSAKEKEDLKEQARLLEEWNKRMPLPIQSKVFISKDLPFEPEDDFFAYNQMQYSERRKMIAKNLKIVTRDDNSAHLKAHRLVKTSVKRDSQLAKNWKFRLVDDPDSIAKMFRVLGQRSMISQNREKELNNDKDQDETVPENILDYLPTYRSPEKRILLMKNLTFNKRNPIPVYCDLPFDLKNLENIHIPNALVFDYTDINFINQFTEPNLTRALDMSKEGDNTIKCTCHDEGGETVPCYDNVSCNCYRVNQVMRSFQEKRNNCSYTEFSSFKPILFTGTHSHFYRHVGFACSELCGCKGNCTNNALLLPNKRLFPIEVFRNNEILGFGVRTLSMIPAGTPVMEFTGEIVGDQLTPGAHWDNGDYAYQISYRDDEQLRNLIKKLNFKPEYEKLIVKLSQKKYYIDPKVQGNVGRMACHSCASNLEWVRVFQKSLSPAHVHLVMVSMVNITAGTPLTIDYGATYTKQRFDSACMCGSFACLNGPDAATYSKAMTLKLSMCHKTLYDAQIKEWRQVIKPAPIESNNEANNENNLPEIVEITEKS